MQYRDVNLVRKLGLVGGIKDWAAEGTTSQERVGALGVMLEARKIVLVDIGVCETFVCVKGVGWFAEAFPPNIQSPHTTPSPMSARNAKSPVPRSRP